MGGQPGVNPDSSPQPQHSAVPPSPQFGGDVPPSMSNYTPSNPTGMIQINDIISILGEAAAKEAALLRLIGHTRVYDRSTFVALHCYLSSCAHFP